MKSKVFFKKVSRDELVAHPDILKRGLKRSQLLNDIAPGSFVGLKVHFGEKGNVSHIKPHYLTSVARLLKKKGAKPFLLETNTLYQGQRMNAIDHIRLANDHGFGALGLPIIIGDGIKGDDAFTVEINQRHFKECAVAAALKDIDYVLVLSHVTGHMLMGFGASIKNIGMGCAARKGKLAQHCEVSPTINAAQCVACGLCAQNCSANAIEKEGDAFCVRQAKCVGCAQCIAVCPHSAVRIVWSESYNDIGEKMVEYAYAVTRGKRCGYINFCLFITQECDCMNTEKSGVIPDVGIVFGSDPVSVDKASLDLLVKSAGRDVLREIHPKVDYLHHLQYAQDIGLGTLDYQLVNL